MAATSAVCQLNMFQFHKVRLKEFQTGELAGRGTFQFHKVRLKGTYGTPGGDTRDMFQFHKVRLKDVMSTYMEEPTLGFNSIRYD